ncbi:hypothetical protein BC941DRAFT_508081 [Chlamydoabsidia padenii]|nr:hypothetical protein BC941DRAFT_508081 [Chlamydoabsidia padenii]
MDKAYVTLVATDTYAAGALVLAHRLRDLGTPHALVCLVTHDISTTVLEHLSQLYKVVCVDTITSTDDDNLALLGRPELNITFTKLHLWNLTDYKKLVFLDADTLPLRNIDDLFDRPNFSAAPDAGWPDCFNSGVFVTEPSESDYHGLKKMATEQGSFDGGDQGLLNTYFKSWSTSPSAHRLPFTYNTTPTSQYSYAPAHQYYVNNISICHFIGLDKPWKYQRFADGTVLSQGWKGLTDLVQSWWDTWNLYYGQNQPHLLLSKSPKDTLVHSHSTGPIKLFSHPIVNAWDTANISDDIVLYEQHRHTDSMPPIANITISTPKWVSEHVHSPHPYPVSSESHTLDSYFDDTSQYSSVDCNDFTGDHGSDYHIPDDDQSQHVFDDDNNNNSNDGDTIYRTIEWNPACESPPNTGTAANIPDLSSFVNAWDQPFQDQPIWIAPEPQPIPKLEIDYGFVHENQQHHHHHHHHHEQQQSHHGDEHQEHHQGIFPWEHQIHQQASDTARIWLDEQNHVTHTETHNQGEPHTFFDHHQHSDYHQHQDHHHDKDTMTRDFAHSDQQFESYDQHFDNTPESQVNTHEQHSDYNEDYYVEEEGPSYAMDLIPSTMSPRRSSRASIYFATSEDNNNNQQTEYDWSDRDLIPISLKRSSKLNIEGLSPSLPQSPIGSRRGSISRSRRSSISSTGRLQHRVITAPNSPSPISTPTKNVPLGTQMDYSLYSRQPVSLFAQENVSYSTKKTPYTSAATTPVREKGSFLYDMDDQQQEYLDDSYQENDTDYHEDYLLDYSFDEPLLMASVTNRQERHRLFGQLPDWNPLEALERLKSTSETMMISSGQHQHQQHQQQGTKETALELDESTEADDQQDTRDTNKTTSNTHYALDAITLGTSPQEDFGRPFYTSGSSSPRTPVVRGLEYNLTAEIEAAREQHRQHQRTALSLLQPHTAVATLLEAELDLSKSSLFNRRHDHNNSSTSNYHFSTVSSTDDTHEQSTSSSSLPVYATRSIDGNNDYDGPRAPTETDYSYYSSFTHQHLNQDSQYLDDNEDADDSATREESFAANFDTSVIDTARRKLNALTQNISATSMSSTTTVNDNYEDDGDDLVSNFGASLRNLSRYSFPPAIYEYTSHYLTPTTVAATTTFAEEEPCEMTSTLQETSPTMDQQSDEETITSLVMRGVDEDDDDDDHDGYSYERVLIDEDEDESALVGDNYDRISVEVGGDDSVLAGYGYDQICISVDDDGDTNNDQDSASGGHHYDQVSISVGEDDVESFGYWDDERLNDNDQNITKWLTLTSGSVAVASELTTADDLDTIYSDDNTMERAITQTSNGSSDSSSDDGNDGDIITSTVDCITQMDEEATNIIIDQSETTHTHTVVVETSTSSESVSITDSSSLGTTNDNDNMGNELEYPVTTTTTTTMTTVAAVPVSTSSWSSREYSAIATPSVISASDDDSDIAFLSAADEIISLVSGSSSQCSSSDWHTVQSSTPRPDEDDSEEDYGDDDEEDHALSLLEINTSSSTTTCNATTTTPTATTTRVEEINRWLRADASSSSSSSVGQILTSNDATEDDNSNSDYISDSISVESELTATGVV